MRTAAKADVLKLSSTLLAEGIKEAPPPPLVQRPPPPPSPPPPPPTGTRPAPSSRSTKAATDYSSLLNAVREFGAQHIDISVLSNEQEQSSSAEVLITPTESPNGLHADAVDSLPPSLQAAPAVPAPRKMALSKRVEYPGDVEEVAQLLNSAEVDPAGRDMFGIPALHKFCGWDSARSLAD